jgi:hypothetical protein
VTYFNGVLAGLLNSQLDHLKSVLKTAARLIFVACRHDHVTFLEELHRLSVPKCIEFKLCILAYQFHSAVKICLVNIYRYFFSYFVMQYGKYIGCKDPDACCCTMKFVYVFSHLATLQHSLVDFYSTAE